MAKQWPISASIVMLYTRLTLIRMGRRMSLRNNSDEKKKEGIACRVAK